MSRLFGAAYTFETTMLPDQQFQIAHARQQQGQLAEAERLCSQILASAPTHFPTLRLLAVIALQTKRYRYATEILTRAGKINGTDPALHNDLGFAFACLRQFDQALASYTQAIALKPDYAAAYVNRGNAQLELRHYRDALASFDAAIKFDRRDVNAHNNRAIALQNLNRFEEAVKSYDAAIKLKPDYGAAYSNRGTVLQKLHRLEEALASYDAALKLNPNNAEAYGNRGFILQELDRTEDALMSFDKAIELKPDLRFLYGNRLLCSLLLCRWTDLDGDLDQIAERLERGERPSKTFPLLATTESTALQKTAAESETSLTPSLRHTHAFQPSPGEKIRLGYFSPDFRDHPISFLMVGVFEQHDRAKFELTAFSFRTSTGKVQERLTPAFDSFIDVQAMSDEEVAALARKMKIDIAVDLAALTRGSRTAIFGHGAAPIQVNYPYPGTMGADYIDYLIADKIVIPDQTRANYAEKIAYLPSYQANDDQRVIAERVFTRAELGLPEDGLVFCAFSNTYKLTPKVFAIWMNILRRVEGSVLWLVEPSPTAVRNLRSEAERHGIAADRLVFAKRIRVDEHLARHRVADLFLDSSPYNAHMTASDALWTGLPVVTCMGESFASRVAGSVLHAVGLPELIAPDWAAYEELAVALAGDPERLAGIKSKLAQNRLSSTLFDTRRFTRTLEQAYQQMYARWARGEAPADFAVAT